MIKMLLRMLLRITVFGFPNDSYMIGWFFPSNWYKRLLINNQATVETIINPRKTGNIIWFIVSQERSALLGFN